MLLIQNPDACIVGIRIKRGTLCVKINVDAITIIILEGKTDSAIYVFTDQQSQIRLMIHSNERYYFLYTIHYFVWDILSKK